MKTFKNVCAQGDVYIRRVESMPTNVIPVNPEHGKVIVTHSETGHHHVMDADSVTMYRLPDSILDCYIKVNDPTFLEHLREHDTHEPILFEKGTYHVRRQREYTAEGFRKAQD